MIRLSIKHDIKVAIRGIIISSVLLRSLIFPALHMLMVLLIPNLAFTVMDAILWLRLAVFIAGLYVGISNAQNKIMISSVIGILYFPMTALIALAVYGKYIDINYTIIFGIMIDGVISILGTILALSIMKWRRRN